MNMKKIQREKLLEDGPSNNFFIDFDLLRNP